MSIPEQQNQWNSQFASDRHLKEHIGLTSSVHREGQGGAHEVDQLREHHEANIEPGNGATGSLRRVDSSRASNLVGLQNKLSPEPDNDEYLSKPADLEGDTHHDIVIEPYTEISASLRRRGQGGSGAPPRATQLSVY